MARYELSVSPDYVPNWTTVEAVREIFQNALDAPGLMSWEYDEEDKSLSIINEDTMLDKQTLLFGMTSKATSNDTIGQFGEGYKLAFLVLARLNHRVVVYNRKNKEQWAPKIIKSRRYNSNVLVIDIFKKPKYDPEGPLVFKIFGITKNMFDQISDSNLHLKPPASVIKTHYGEILLDRKHEGQVYIKGLFVCHKSNLKYGYDIRPAYLETNRDRNLVSDFNIQWITSRIWSEAGKPAEVSRMLKDKSEKITDVYYMSSFKSPELSNTMYAEFTAMHGKYAVPVDDQDEYDLIKKTYKKLKPIFVKPSEKEVIYNLVSANTISSAQYRVERKYPDETMIAFWEKHENDIPNNAFKKELKAIVELSKDWTLK